MSKTCFRRKNFVHPWASICPNFDKNHLNFLLVNFVFFFHPLYFYCFQYLTQSIISIFITLIEKSFHSSQLSGLCVCVLFFNDIRNVIPPPLTFHLHVFTSAHPPRHSSNLKRFIFLPFLSFMFCFPQTPAHSLLTICATLQWSILKYIIPCEHY